MTETISIESEIQELIDRKNIIFHQWTTLNKTISPEIDIEEDMTETHQKINDLMTEQRNISKEIMKLYQKIDELSEI